MLQDGYKRMEVREGGEMLQGVGDPQAHPGSEERPCRCHPETPASRSWRAARWKNKQTAGRQTTRKAGVGDFLYVPLKGQAS